MASKRVQPARSCMSIYAAKPSSPSQALTVVPVPKAKPMSLQILESPDIMELLVDFLRSRTFMLASCSKKMRELYGEEAKSWKSLALFSRRNLYMRVDLTMYKVFMNHELPSWRNFRYKHHLPFYFPGMRVGLSISSSQVVRGDKETQYFQEYNPDPRLAWGSFEREVRRLCKELRDKGIKDFRIELVSYRAFFKPEVNRMANILITSPIPLYVKLA